MPSGELFDSMQSLLKKIAQTYNTPVFEPHVIFLGSISDAMISNAGNLESLAEQLSPLTIHLKGCCMGDSYYTSVYSPAEKTPELIKANVLGQEVFGVSADFDPHLSLAYGDLQYIHKRRIMRSLSGIDVSFTAETLFLYRTDGPVGKWKRMQEIPLT